MDGLLSTVRLCSNFHRQLCLPTSSNHKTLHCLAAHLRFFQGAFQVFDLRISQTRSI